MNCHQFFQFNERKRNQGQTLLEILIALTIFASLGGILILSLAQLIRRQSTSTTTNLSTFLLQQTMEDVYAISKTNQWDQLQPQSTPPPVYIQPNNFNSWNITTSPADPTAQFQSAVYVYPVFRYDSTPSNSNDDNQNNIDPTNCPPNNTNPNCDLDSEFKQITIRVYLTKNPTDILITATHYLTSADNITLTGTGATPTPNPNLYNSPLNDLGNPITIQASNDDATRTSTTLELTNATLTLGGNNTNWVGLRFPNINIPPYSTILSAYVMAKTPNTNYIPNSNFQYLIYGDLNTTNPDFATQDPRCTTGGGPRNCTTQFDTYTGADETGNPNSWSANSWYGIGNVTNILQEVINTSGASWNPVTNAITLLFRGNSTASRQILSFDSGSRPELYLAYATPTPTPMPIPVTAIFAQWFGTDGIYLTSPSGSQTRLTNTPSYIPIFSPTGDKIAYIACPNGRSDVMLMNTDGTNILNLTNFPSGVCSWVDESIKFTPDGSQIIYRAYVPTVSSSAEIVSIRTNGSGVNWLTNTPGYENYFDISPNGAQIVYSYQPPPPNPTYYSHLMIMNINGSGQTILTNNSIYNDIFGKFSPNGAKIAFSRYPTSYDPNFFGEIFTINPDSTGLTQITSSGVNGRSEIPIFHPDGRIIYESSIPAGVNYDENIYIMNQDGSNKIKLTFFAPGSNGLYYHRISADGNWLMYRDNSGVWGQIYVQALFDFSNLLYTISGNVSLGNFNPAWTYPAPPTPTPTPTPTPAIAYDNTGQADSSMPINYSADFHLAQGIISSSNLTITSIQLYLNKTNLPLGQAWIEIQTNNALNDPSGTIISNGTSDLIPINSIGPTQSWINFAFLTPPTITGSTQYHIVLKANYPQNTTNYINWGSDVTAPGYTNGIAQQWASGPWWDIFPPRDFLFRVYGY